MSAADYLELLTNSVEASGHRADKPIAFLCNPPYRSDDDQSVSAPDYLVDPTIATLTGADAASERYCCFLAQMKLVCEQARLRGAPEGSLLLLFTKSAWMSDRSVFQPIRRAIAGSFELVDGLLVNGAEFFDLKGRFPVAFTIWRYAPKAELRADRALVLRDLTWMRRSDLRSIAWAEPAGEHAWSALLSDPRSHRVALGVQRPKMREWSGATSTDFKRSRRKTEPLGTPGASGLPHGDRRVANKKAYGEGSGSFVGFMDDLTPCRVARHVQPARPWFRLDAPFMDCRKGRCLSGPPDQKGFCASDGDRAERLFQWFALQRTLAAHGYPMWVDNLQLWPMAVPDRLRGAVRQVAFAIGFAENECVETTFPADNPTRGAPASRATNPLSPLDRSSFWSTTMATCFEGGRRGRHPGAHAVVEAVRDLYAAWQTELGRDPVLRVSYARSYFVGRGVLTRDSGIVQIKDYADERKRPLLRAAYDDVQAALKALRAELHAMLLDARAIHYFAEPAR